MDQTPTMTISIIYCIYEPKMRRITITMNMVKGDIEMEGMKRERRGIKENPGVLQTCNIS